jgi:hypothetical protein
MAAVGWRAECPACCLASAARAAARSVFAHSRRGRACRSRRGAQWRRIGSGSRRCSHASERRRCSPGRWSSLCGDSVAPGRSSAVGRSGPSLHPVRAACRTPPAGGGVDIRRRAQPVHARNPTRSPSPARPGGVLCDRSLGDRLPEARRGRGPPRTTRPSRSSRQPRRQQRSHTQPTRSTGPARRTRC